MKVTSIWGKGVAIFVGGNCCGQPSKHKETIKVTHLSVFDTLWVDADPAFCGWNGILWTPFVFSGYPFHWGKNTFMAKCANRRGPEEGVL